MIGTTILEYIWIGGKNEIRSKTRVLYKFFINDYTSIPEWNYDGSSTWQADSNGDTEIILKPRAIFKDPLRTVESSECYLVLCDTYKSNGEPTETNHRFSAAITFEDSMEDAPWFGLEQEYFIISNKDSNIDVNDGYSYCGTAQNNCERFIVEQHLKMCVEIGIRISGINAEVSRGQWEFQVGPCEGIEAGDHVTVARYILERLAENVNAKIDYRPKPIAEINGSGCHINFSTSKTRSENGIEYIDKYIGLLEKKHAEHISVYGENNNLRLTGLHETSSINKFSWGVGTRNTSVRIPNQVYKDKCGYFEDRRPAANIDPYLATSKIYETCCL